MNDYGTIWGEQLEDEVWDYYDNGLPKGLDTGWAGFDKHITFAPGSLNLICGAPNSGKSAFLDEILFRLVKKHEIGVAMFTPENQPYGYHMARLTSKYTGKPFHNGPTPRVGKDELEMAINFIKKRFTWISPQEFKRENILKTFEGLQRYGKTVFVIDPFTDIEKDMGRMREDLWLNGVLTEFRNFARKSKVILFIACHPRVVTPDKKTGSTNRVIMPYDISGGAMWYNKADSIMSIRRMYDDLDTTELHVLKIRFQQAYGELTKEKPLEFYHDKATGNFTLTGME